MKHPLIFEISQNTDTSSLNVLLSRGKSQTPLIVTANQCPLSLLFKSKSSHNIRLCALQHVREVNTINFIIIVVGFSATVTFCMVRSRLNVRKHYAESWEVQRSGKIEESSRDHFRVDQPFKTVFTALNTIFTHEKRAT